MNYMAYSFGDFTLDPQTGTLTGPNGVVPLRRQAFRLCEVLLESAPELMSRDQLLDAVWGRTAISPNVLPQTMSELRRALDDDPQSPSYIETMHRRGYRLVCQVSIVNSVIETPAAPGTVKSSGAANEIEGVHRRLLMPGIVLATLLAIGWFTWESSQESNLYQKVMPGILEAVDSDVFKAWSLTREALIDHPDDPSLRQLLLDLAVPVSLHSEPSGATISVGPYDAAEGEWVQLGSTPIENVRLPLTMLRFRVQKGGFKSLDVAPSILPFPQVFQLHAESDSPSGMVFVPAGPVTYMGESRNLKGFWIQENEVTNLEYQEFVDAGGYQNTDYWNLTAPGNDAIGSELIVSAFVDSTELPGPSTWSLGAYPEGQGTYPVEGISWYEAAAYARFRGLQLPTVFHWWRAAGRGTPQHINFADIIASSNYQGRGAWPTGKGGLGPHGTRDMAGNVGEWCANRGGEQRHFLGGSWLNNSFSYLDWYAQPALTRAQGFGMRLMKVEGDIPEQELVALSAPMPQSVKPISDATFAIFARQYDYDSSPLNSKIESVDDSNRSFQRETIKIDAAYGGERLTLQFFIPVSAVPPYQVVVHFPGGDAVMLNDSAEAGLLSVQPFLSTGRAVVYPVYKGTFDRKVKGSRGPLAIRREVIQQTQDVGRTIDYLLSREDVDPGKIAFHGISYGAIRAPFILAIEQRFATAMILGAGITAARMPPEITVEHYLPRVKTPTLFISGKADFNHSYEKSQLPFFDLLGTSDLNKRHVTFDSGHLPTGYSELQKEVIAWLNETLGKP